MSLWTDLGFRSNPYSPTPIQATEEGASLLVGRHVPLKRLIRGITSADTIPTIEGDNGVGKTSLVAVATFSLRQEFKTGNSPQLFLPLENAFQLLPSEDLSDFRRQVYFSIARSFIKHGAKIKGAGLAAPDHHDVEQWLNAPIIKSRGGGASVGGTGGSLGTNKSANDGVGFRDEGFQNTVDSWLSDCFPSREQGGFICLLDNLELLETSQAARAQLEALRDSLLSRTGLRWILCGARGIVRSAASSPRLTGVLSEPVELDPVSDSDIAEVVRRRIDAFVMSDDAFVPVDSIGFDHVYRTLNRNLRDSLKYCEDFTFWMDELGQFPEDESERFKLLEIWLAEQADTSLRATSNVKPRAWSLFDDLVSLGGTCSPSDFEIFEFSSSMAMRPHVKLLEEANLVVSSVSDTDHRRKHIALTSRGWLVNYQRSGYKAPR